MPAYSNIKAKQKFFLASLINLKNILSDKMIFKIYVGFILPYVEYAFDSYALFNLKYLNTSYKINLSMLKLVNIDTSLFSIYNRLKKKYITLLIKHIEKKLPNSFDVLFCCTNNNISRMTRRNITLPYIYCSKSKFSISYVIKSLYAKILDFHEINDIKSKNIESIINALPDNIFDFYNMY